MNRSCNHGWRGAVCDVVETKDAAIERLQSRIDLLLKLLGEKVGDACTWNRALSDAEIQLVHESMNVEDKT